MHDVIVHSLFELAVNFSSASKQKLLSESKEKLQSPVDNKLKNFYFPVSEMLMTIYLHAFPTCTNEIDSEKEMTTETNDDTYDIETKVILLSFSTFKECIKYNFQSACICINIFFRIVPSIKVKLTHFERK